MKKPGANTPGFFVIDNDRDDIDELKAGDEIIIDTGKYKFTYSVSQVFVVSKNEFSTNPIVIANQEGRLLLVSCWSSSANYGGSAVNNVVVKAMLDSVELEIETPPSPPSA